VPLDHVIALDHLTVDLGDVRVLDDVTFTIDRGDFVGIIGPNGSGKTTLLRTILDLLPPSAGSVQLFGVPPAAFTEWHKIGYVPQRTTFDPSLTVRVDEVVMTGLLATGRRWGRGADGRRRVAEALGIVGMQAHAASRVGRLSIGQQQRVLIARAVVSNPELLILDEPTGGIDPGTQTSLYALLQELRGRGVTVVLVSHDVGVVAREVTKLACLNRRVIFCGRPQDYIAHERLTELYGSAVRIVGHEPPCEHAG